MSGIAIEMQPIKTFFDLDIAVQEDAKNKLLEVQEVFRRYLNPNPSRVEAVSIEDCFFHIDDLRKRLDIVTGVDPKKKEHITQCMNIANFFIDAKKVRNGKVFQKKSPMIHRWLYQEAIKYIETFEEFKNIIFSDDYQSIYEKLKDLTYAHNDFTKKYVKGYLSLPF